MVAVILSVISAAVSLFGVIYEKKTKNENLRIVILVAVLGFIFSIAQIGVDKLDKRAEKRDKKILDSVVFLIDKNIDTIKGTLKTGDLSKLGSEVKLQNVHLDGQYVDDEFGITSKGRYFDYRSFFTSLLSKPDIQNDNYALRMTLGRFHYKLNLIMNYLLTTDRSNFITNPRDFEQQTRFNLHDFQTFSNKSIKPILKYILFFDHQNILKGYANSQDFANELSSIYLQGRIQQDLFNNELEANPAGVLGRLRCYRKAVFINLHSTLAIAKTLIENSESECIVMANQKYYKIDLAKIIKVD